MADMAPVKVYRTIGGTAYRPTKRKPGADKRTPSLRKRAFAANTYRGGRVSPSEGEASGGGAM